MTNTTMIINCPTCQKSISWTDKYPQKPFCSDRCKLMDLGAWADEQHRIPAEPIPEHDESMQVDSIE